MHMQKIIKNHYVDLLFSNDVIFVTIFSNFF
jgi:hypothetical protein